MNRTLLYLGAAIGLLAGQANADTFVLVHGAFQTSESWAPVAQGLEAAGHKAVAINLPGRGEGAGSLGDVTMDDHVSAVTAAIDAAGPDKVILVGHSFGGMVISQVGEAAPEKIQRLIYVAAYLPATGQSMQDLAMMDHHNGFKADSFQVAADYSHASLNPRDREEIFANDADEATAKRVAGAMVNEPLKPIATPVTLTESGFGSISKAFIVTLKDNAVSLPMQLTMIGRGKLDEVIPISAGHAPQIVATGALVEALITAATPALD